MNLAEGMVVVIAGNDILVGGLASAGGFVGGLGGVFLAKKLIERRMCCNPDLTKGHCCGGEHPKRFHWKKRMGGGGS